MKNKNKINVINIPSPSLMPTNLIDSYPLTMETKRIFCAYHDT